jgi:hypothetical protein
VAGIAVGALALTGGYIAASDDGSTQTTATTTTVAAATSTPVTTAVPDDTPVAFPPGFAEVVDMIGIKPEYMIDTGDELVIAFTTATRRGFEGTETFDGGDWVLETAGGDELRARGVSRSIAVAGTFSVQFAKEGEVVPESLRLTNRWELDFRNGSTEIPFTGTPFEVAGVAVDLGSDVSLVIESLSLDENGAEVAWSLEGAGDHGATVDLFLQVGGDNAASAFYFDTGGGFNPFDPFDTFDPSELAGDGVLVLNRQEDGGGSLEGPLSIEVNATVVGTIPADLTFDLQGLPGLER